MSNKRSQFREGSKNVKRTEHGPTFEGPNPGAGCNSTHVARSRSRWKRRQARSLRRTGKTSPKFHGPKQLLPDGEDND